jgi:hypothetical protein
VALLVYHAIKILVHERNIMLDDVTKHRAQYELLMGKAREVKLFVSTRGKQQHILSVFIKKMKLQMKIVKFC